MAGMYARIRIPHGQVENAIVIPQTAVGLDLVGSFLLTVDEKNTVVRKAVKTGETQDGFTHIVSGIEPDDKIIVNGLQNARPGAVVEPELINLENK